MRIITIVAILCLYISTVYSQSGKPRYVVTYSLYRTNRFDNVGHHFSPANSHSIFGKLELGKKENVKFSFGVGYLQPHVIEYDYTGTQPFKDKEVHYRFNYIVLPIGAKFKVGGFYILPEVGPSTNFNVKIKSYSVDAEMQRTGEIISDECHTRESNTNLANFLSMGYEFKLGDLILSTAVKGFIAFNDNYFHTNGIGLDVGIKL